VTDDRKAKAVVLCQVALLGLSDVDVSKLPIRKPKEGGACE
jgi:hypothetical protein